MKNSYRLSVISCRLKAICSKKAKRNCHNALPKTDNRRLTTLKWLLFPFSFIVFFVLANWCFPLPKSQLHRPSSPIVLDRNGEWLRAFLAADGMWRFMVNQKNKQTFYPNPVGAVSNRTDDEPELKTDNR